MDNFKRVLVTGGTGFIGHHLIEHILKNTKWNIVILDRLDSASSMQRLTEIDSWEQNQYRIRFVWHDLKSEINNLIGNQLGQFDYIFHLAAASHVDRSIDEPMSFVMDNVVGTCNLLNYARNNLFDGGKVFNFSTDEVFGPAPDGKSFKEDDRWKPSNPYSATKAGQTALGYCYYVTYGLPVITTYAMNNFGERQYSEKFVPRIIKALLDKKPVPIHARLKDGVPTEVGIRHWLHARNSADALLFLAEYGSAGESYNIVGDIEVTNFGMATFIADIMNKKLEVEYIDFHKSRPGHDRRYALDGTKIKNLGWIPPMDFHGSLEKTVKWSLKNPQWL